MSPGLLFLSFSLKPQECCRPNPMAQWPQVPGHTFHAAVPWSCRRIPRAHDKWTGIHPCNASQTRFHCTSISGQLECKKFAWNLCLHKHFYGTKATIFAWRVADFNDLELEKGASFICLCIKWKDNSVISVCVYISRVSCSPCVTVVLHGIYPWWIFYFLLSF